MSSAETLGVANWPPVTVGLASDKNLENDTSHDELIIFTETLNSETNSKPTLHIANADSNYISLCVTHAILPKTVCNTVPTFKFDL